VSEFSLPSFIFIILSFVLFIRLKSCEITRTVEPVLLIVFNISKICNALSVSRFPVGSSAINKSGLLASALAIAPLCFSPPDSSYGNKFLLSLKPTRSKR